MLWSFLVNVLANRKKGNTLPNNHYYIINQILLSAFHLWPYQCSRFIIINHIINLLLSLSFCFFQLTSFLTYQISMDLLIMVLSYAVPSFICTIQYCSFCIKSNAVKQILKDIHNSWSVLKNEMERDIMRKYSFSGQLCTILLFLCLVINLILYAFLQLLPDILNIINPLNETRPHQTYAVTEYFVDPKQYYYPILCHWLFSIFFNSSIMIATTTLHIVYVEHICGMLSVASYRIEHSIEKHASSNSTDKEASVIFQNISTAVELHRKAVQCSTFLSTTFALDFFLMVVASVLSLSLNLMRLFKAISLLKDVNELISSVLLVGAQLLFMYLDNYYGQKLTDHNNKIFYNAYNTPWYTVSTKIQKLFLFIMKYTTKTYILNIGNLIMASIEGFAKLISLSISYFTVIYSLQR
ncbi:uncharacterized protein LOC109503779 isoform X1 [Harpegnathos saltator]|uniref:uncharacterized protein LOC109503779 isoform X1 n=1 Tax=Harpegnathos saltator TaxID=610380 RepID=UPI000948A652|nr:uncharacterized protein LOC109503779 isoform X1 [Harpegnathos saltator]